MAVMIVEADVEPRARLRRDHVACAITDIDRGEFEVGGLEMRATVVERIAGERDDQRGNVRYGIGRAMRIGDVALNTVDNEGAGQRAAAADLDAVAKLLDIAWLAQHAMV